MVIYHLKDMMLRKSAELNSKITYSHIVQATDISRVTLTRMAAKPGHKVNIDIIEKLCNYFNCTPNDLMTIIPDPPEGDEQVEVEKVK